MIRMFRQLLLCHSDHLIVRHPYVIRSVFVTLSLRHAVIRIGFLLLSFVVHLRSAIWNDFTLGWAIIY
jgi:hypothetical protein